MIIPHSIIADSFRRAGGYFNCLESGEHFIGVQRAAVVSSRSDEYRARAAECLERAQEARDFEVKRTADWVTTFWINTSLARNSSDGMSKFKITVARIEVDARGKQDEQVRITFQIDRAPISFQVPILLSIRDFDDTEVVRAARNALHRTFVELAAQSQRWKLTSEDLRQLSSMSVRPKT